MYIPEAGLDSPPGKNDTLRLLLASDGQPQTTNVWATAPGKTVGGWKAEFSYQIIGVDGGLGIAYVVWYTTM